MSISKSQIKKIADELEAISDRLDKLKSQEEDKENPNDEHLEVVEQVNGDLEALVDTLRDTFEV